MSQSIAVAVVHGVGKQDEHFADGIVGQLRAHMRSQLGGSVPQTGDEIVCAPVFWQPCIQDDEDELWTREKTGGSLAFHQLRRFMIDFAGDAIAYQPTPWGSEIYDDIHRVFAEALHELADRAGAKAPLCVIAHSLGTIISSNFLYDLQAHFGRKRQLLRAPVLDALGSSPLERGETLAHFYTLGSPLAVWSLRYDNFGIPIKVPSPELGSHWHGLDGEWVNFYDEHDIIGYPLKPLNQAYDTEVVADIQVDVGGILTGWNPACHTHYWKDRDVTMPIARALARTWRQINQMPPA